LAFFFILILSAGDRKGIWPVKNRPAAKIPEVHFWVTWRNPE